MVTIQKMKLVSNNIGYGPEPNPDDEVEQILTLAADGEVDFWSYLYGDGEPYDRVNIHRKDTVIPERARKVLELVGAYFDQHPVSFDVTDVGLWTLTLTDENGTELKYEGPLSDQYVLEGHNLSVVLRETLAMPDLFAFDDRGEEIHIDRVMLDYHRVKQIKRDPVFGPDIGYMAIETTERLMIDRATATIDLYRQSAAGVEERHSYSFFDRVDVLLDEFDETLFNEMPETPVEVAEDPLDRRYYAISMELSSGKRVERSGYYDKYGVPSDLRDFLSELEMFLRPYTKLEIFNPDLFMRSNRVREPELIFCSCSFQRGGQTYYYLTEDETLSIGDFVWVPAGKGNQEKVVRIEEIKVYPQDKPPFDPYSTKRVLRRCEVGEVPAQWTTFDPPTFFCPLIEREVTPEECEGICLVVQNGYDPSALDGFDPPIEVDLTKEAKCWQCNNPWFNN